MDNYDELIKLIIKWSNSVLNMSISSIDDFKDGHIFLESLLRCKTVVAPKLKNHRYEVIEETLDDFYKVKTNLIVNYEYLALNEITYYDDIIRLSVLIIGMCQSFGKSPTNLDDSEYQLLYTLIKPIDRFIKNGELITITSIDYVIKKVTEKDLDDYSMNSSYSHITESSCMIGKQHNSVKMHTQVDDNDNSFNVQSHTSETSNFMLGHSNKKSNYDKSFNDDSTDSRRSRRSRGVLAHRSTTLKYTGSHKISEDLKKLKEKEEIIRGLKEDLRLYERRSDKIMSELEKEKENIQTIVYNNRKLTDDLDVMEAEINNGKDEIHRKEMEVAKLSKQVSQVKEDFKLKISEMAQINQINKDLRVNIDCLEDKLKRQIDEYDKVKIAEIEYIKDNENLKDEIHQLKRDLEKCKNDLTELQIQPKVRYREECIESPIPQNEGESMAVVTEMIFGEEQLKMRKQIEEHQKEIKELRNEIEIRDSNSNVHQNELKVLEQKYRETVTEMKEYSVQLNNANKVIAGTHNRAPQYHDVKSMDCEGVIKMLTVMFVDTELTSTEKRTIVNSLSQVLQIEEKEETHRICQAQMTLLHQRLAMMQQSFEKECNKNEEWEALCEQRSDELNQMNEENTKLTKYISIKQAKINDDTFKYKNMVLKEHNEKNEIEAKYNELKRDFKRTEINLEKSNHEYNVVRENYDQSLQYLKVLSTNCDNYAEIMKTIEEQEQTVYRNTGSQTDKMSHFSSIGTNVMSPRTPVTIKRSNICSLNDPAYRPWLDQCDRKYQDSPYTREHSTAYYRPHTYASPISSAQPSRSLRMPAQIYRDNTHVYDKTSRKIADQSTYRNDRVDQSTQMKPLEQKWIAATRRRECSGTKPDSPLVKAERLNQMWSRNLCQPDHMKSSYPVETQNVEPGYVENVFMATMNLSLDHPQFTDHLANLRRYSAADGRYPRMDMRSESKENAFTDRLLKLPESGGVLSARSMNLSQRSPRAILLGEAFRKPCVPQLNLERGGPRDLRDDRENATPTRDIEDYQRSLSTSSTSFSIMNSPKVKQRGLPPSRNTRRK